MAHTNHTMTNQIRQPVATRVRSIETSFASALWVDARGMRRYVCQVLEWDVFARRCAEFGLEHA
jgi:hypothetical protein